jgi:hypothetical protein
MPGKFMVKQGKIPLIQWRHIKLNTKRKSKIKTAAYPT